MVKALEAVTVADFTHVVAGPYATMLLADFGADVIKVERPGIGDDTRSWPPYDAEGTSTYYNAVNRNKRSMVIDLKTKDGVAQARELAARSDILVENYRPGTMERFGLGYEDLRILQPQLIYCSITGFGYGRGRDLAGYDLLAQAVGGLMSVTGPAPGQPIQVGVPVVDVLTGAHAFGGILAALHYRERTGKGQRVDVNLLSVLLSSLTNQASVYLGTGKTPSIVGNRNPSVAPYQIFRTKDRPIVIAAGNDKLFVAMARAIGQPELAERPEYSTNTARVTHNIRLTGELNTALEARNASHWLSLLGEAGVPAGPINNVAEALELAQSLGLNPVTNCPDAKVAQIANPIALSATPAQYRSGPPALGSAQRNSTNLTI
ncbi:L-carnitine dehydratase/bile acid-inducible protein F [Mycobacteroides abscessus subsp. abscessus]|uniref:CaiB/BaiF CoA transferase family protein n=1 Tax=Mycobacteroides abscessus TaxID=36809 RepID=UPI00092893C7|nr:CoA transferase [Mycobacteroides abscessus]SIL80893.1 L-carnitine dehydratase/bile acid-inducible protein F [Mycobacteroides abscessus subsp. abscessus]SLE51804.1 L-carnitine dehydratase/bile acid-inducible protein F [Mycobacteroides abscessus subsp. abscessus]